MQLGHDASFDQAPGSAFRILLRFWGGAITSLDRYRADVDTDALARIVPVAQIPMLVMLGVWMERTCDQRYHTQVSAH